MIPAAVFLVANALFTNSGTPSLANPPLVISVSPPNNHLTAGVSAAILMSFDQPIDPASFTPATLQVFGHWSGVIPPQVFLENGNTLVRIEHNKPFSAGELVTVSVAKSVRSATGDSMLSGYTWTFWARSQPGTMNLTLAAPAIPIRRLGEGHIQSYGAYGGDFNADGHLDLAIPNEISADVRLFLNDSTGFYDTFSVFPIPGGSYPSPNEGVDLNRDGLLDYVVGNAGNNKLTVFMGNGLGGFTSITSYNAAQAVRGVALADVEGDGDMDVITANRTGNNMARFLNTGNGTMTGATFFEAGGTNETACATADANGDGILDLFVGAYGSNEMILMLGNASGDFTVSHELPARGRPWMIAVGDVNGDGHVDVVSANSTSNNASVMLTDGQGHLDSADTYPTGVFPLAIDLGDIDGDGDLDLVTSNYGSGTWTVYENSGSGVFGNSRTLQASRAGSCATLYDRDNDGDLDLTGIDELDDLVFLFVNTPPTSAEVDRPVTFSLHQNFPNPFNSSTRIAFSMPFVSLVKLSIHDLLGREVEILLEEPLAGGEHSIIAELNDLPSGVYVYRLTAGGFTRSRKMVLLR